MGTFCFRILRIMGILLLLGVSACEDKMQAISFHVDKDIKEVQNFTWGKEQIYKISLKGVERISVLSAPKGWSVVVDMDALKIKPPLPENAEVDVKGNISLFLLNAESSSQIDLQVEIPTSMIIDLTGSALFEKSEVLWAKNSRGDTVAQVCREYARLSSASPEKAIRAIVVYAYDTLTRTFRRGVVTNNGGTLNHDGSGYRDGSKAPTNVVYMVEGHCWLSGDGFQKPLAHLIPDTVVDVERNVYGIVKIGAQYWMRENLRTTKYRDGSEISSGFYWYKDDMMDVAASERLKKLFGGLYSLSTARNQKLCPEGWRVASDEDWMKMELFLGMPPSEAEATSKRAMQIGKCLKSEGEEWFDHGAGTNLSGFGAVPGGTPGRAIKIYGYYWSIPSTGNWPGYRLLSASQNSVLRTIDSAPGLSVRCVWND